MHEKWSRKPTTKPPKKCRPNRHSGNSNRPHHRIGSTDQHTHPTRRFRQRQTRRTARAGGTRRRGGCGCDLRSVIVGTPPPPPPPPASRHVCYGVVGSARGTRGWVTGVLSGRNGTGDLTQRLNVTGTGIQRFCQIMFSVPVTVARPYLLVAMALYRLDQHRELER